MNIPLILASVLAVLSAGTPAYADEDCHVPMSKWQSRNALHSMAEALGWDVRRIKIDDGCYEISGYGPSGREFEVKIDPGSLAIIEMEFESRNHFDGDDDDD